MIIALSLQSVIEMCEVDHKSLFMHYMCVINVSSQYLHSRMKYKRYCLMAKKIVQIEDIKD